MVESVEGGRKKERMATFSAFELMLFKELAVIMILECDYH